MDEARAMVWGWTVALGWDGWLIQFRALYRSFLLRVIDLELLANDADPSRLMGQFATLFITISFFFTIPTLFVLLGGGSFEPTTAWMCEHFFLETTMTVAGLIAVMNWESAFPDRRDVLVLAPLPVSASTLFLAKVAALFAAPALAMVAFNLFTGFTWSLIFAPRHSGVLGMARALLAYWSTIFLGGVFLVLTILAVQGLAANLLPRQVFLRVSAFLQAGALCGLLSVYFLEPSFYSVKTLTAAGNQRALAWLPSYWFLGLFQQLNGTMHPAMMPLAHRAWMGLAMSAVGAGAAMVLAYFRMMPKIVEQAEIEPVGLKLGSGWSFGLSGTLQGTIALFSARTLLRSRQHRMILSFYVGIGLALLVGYFKAPFGKLAVATTGIGTTLLVGSTLMMILVVLALRMVASIPISLRANWIVRLTQVRPARGYRSAVRFSWLLLGVGPVWIVVAGLLLAEHSRGWPVVGHLAVVLVLGMLVVELCLASFDKIPFTCSYLPGKANLHLVFWVCLVLLIWVLNWAAKLESRLLLRVGGTMAMIVCLLAAWMVARWVNEARGGGDELVFEEEDAVEMVSLNLR